MRRGGGRVTQIGRGFLTKETGISSDSNTRQSRRHTSLYASVITKKKTKTKNKVLVTVKSFSPVYLSILISSHVLILIGEIMDSGLKVNISFFKKNTDKYLGLLDFITLTRSLFTCVRQKKSKSMKKLKGKGSSSESYFQVNGSVVFTS